MNEFFHSFPFSKGNFSGFYPSLKREEGEILERNDAAIME